MRPSRWLLLSCLLLPVATSSSTPDERALYTPEELRKLYELSPVPKLPPDRSNAYADNGKAAELGKSLFFDKRLSCAGNVSCATCHDPAKGWSDGLPTPKVFMNPHAKDPKAVSKRRVPSLWNVAYNRWQFWDGRADSLWSQALGPPENPIEMEGGSRLLYAHVVFEDKDLRRKYEGLFGKMPDLADEKRFPLNGCPKPDAPQSAENKAWESMAPADRTAVNRIYSNIGKSLEAFERRIVSKDSRFDAYVAALKSGRKEALTALTDQEKRGLKLFVGKAQCVACHSGPNFTDGGFHNLRVPSRNRSLAGDPGRYNGIAAVKKNTFNAAGEFSDDRSDATRKFLEGLEARPIHKGQFKTPGLRNVASFAPYMHQGQVATLRKVVEYYSTLEGAVPLKGPDEGLLTAVHLKGPEIDDLLSFLGALTDESALKKLGLP